jgi:hypothetical protein
MNSSGAMIKPDYNHACFRIEALHCDWWGTEN